MLMSLFVGLPYLSLPFYLAAGLTQQQIAEKLDLDRSSVAKYEKGESTPNLKNLPEICKALNISIDELLKDIMQC